MLNNRAPGLVHYSRSRVLYQSLVFDHGGSVGFSGGCGSARPSPASRPRQRDRDPLVQVMESTPQNNQRRLVIYSASINPAFPIASNESANPNSDIVNNVWKSSLDSAVRDTLRGTISLRMIGKLTRHRFPFRGEDRRRSIYRVWVKNLTRLAPIDPISAGKEI